MSLLGRERKKHCARVSTMYCHNESAVKQNAMTKCVFLIHTVCQVLNSPTVQHLQTHYKQFPQYSFQMYHLELQNIRLYSRVKGKVHPITCHEGRTGGVEVQLYSL